MLKMNSQIIKYNIRDYWHRIIGKFNNEFGAHAGFTEREFLKMSKLIFSSIIPLRSRWIEVSYPKYSKVFKLAKKVKIADFIYPSNYYLINK